MRHLQKADGLRDRKPVIIPTGRGVISPVFRKFWERIPKKEVSLSVIPKTLTTDFNLEFFGAGLVEKLGPFLSFVSKL